MSFKKFPKLKPRVMGNEKGTIQTYEEWRRDTVEKLEKMIKDYENNVGELRYSSVELMKQFLEALR